MFMKETGREIKLMEKEFISQSKQGEYILGLGRMTCKKEKVMRLGRTAVAFKASF